MINKVQSNLKNFAKTKITQRHVHHQQKQQQTFKYIIFIFSFLIAINDLR